MTCVNGKIIKSRKIVVHEPSQASARMSPCIDWFLETYENGSLVSSIYVGTTCSCETRIAAPNARLASVECAGKGSPSSYTTSPSGSSSSLGDVFLCPNSLRVDHTDVDRRLISTYGVKVGVGSNYMKYGIDAYLPNQINPSNVSWDDDSFELLRIWGKDYDAWAGVDKVGNTYKVSDAALRILVSRASDFATRDYDVNRLGRLNDKPAYREAIINSMTSYLQEYFGQNANMMIELPNLRQTPDTPDAVLTDSWFNYWVGNCR